MPRVLFSALLVFTASLAQRETEACAKPCLDIKVITQLCFNIKLLLLTHPQPYCPEGKRFSLTSAGAASPFQKLFVSITHL